MATIDHVTLRTSDLERSLELYSRVFDLLSFDGERFDGDAFHEWNDFSIAQADDEHPPTHGVHIGFAAASRAQVDDWWRALTAAGYESDGAPGLRCEYGPDYYGAFVLDHDRNSIEAVHHRTATPTTGVIDHLWIRVAELAASKRFYTGIAPAVGVRARDLGERLHVISTSGTFSLIAGSPTENLHLAIGVEDRERVRDFHAFGLHSGGRDNGAPDERPEYHAGYYAAYLLDPDSNNVEAVFHDRAV